MTRENLIKEALKRKDDFFIAYYDSAVGIDENLNRKTAYMFVAIEINDAILMIRNTIKESEIKNFSEEELLVLAIESTGAEIFEKAVENFIENCK